MKRLYEIVLKSQILESIDNSPLPFTRKVEILNEIYNSLIKIIEEDNRE